ncbi:MAG: penicillin acylase family protein [Alphaproteobacteria bacterium]|nr:MAG: penicillin acylase family protein [Alphaproteobacteria bacterium]
MAATRKRTAFRILAGLVAAVLLVALFAWVYVRTSLPTTSGRIALAGLTAPVTVVRDDNGIPHIIAENEADAAFALGFVHAQDRLWQMEMRRRVASGRLSEFAGPSTVATDRYLRTLSLYDRARKSWPHQSPAAQTLLKAYAAGVNAYIGTHRGAWPPEFLITGVRPERWTPIDSLGWLKMMSLDLGGNMGRELSRLDLAGTLDAKQLAEFFPPYPGDPSIPLPDLKALYDGLDLRTASATVPAGANDLGLGSNNWVVSGSRTKSGKPLLANDPHLGLTTPSLWYLVHMKIAGHNLVGASMPGVPGIILGRNDHIAWGFTNVNPDVQDLYLEKLTEDGSGYLTPDGSEAFRSRTETIEIKDAPPVTFTVRETRHGPVISDARGDIRAALPDGYALALRWTALEEDDTTPSVATSLAEARNFEEFTEALKAYVTPMQNMVFADAAGNIGYIAPGRVPVRAPENDTHGLVPAPGWKAGYEWTGYLPYGALPRRYNPEEGFIATANEKIVGPDYPHFLTSGWAMPYRGDRIRSLLAASETHDADSMARIQADVHSTLADDLLPLMLAHMKAPLPDAVAALAAWDREMRADRPEPLLFSAWHRHLAKRVYADELGDKFPRYWGAKPNFLHRVLAAEDDYARWCDDVTTDALETCDDTVAAAFADAMADLEARLGGDWQSWRWGTLHQVIQRHEPLSEVAALRPFFELRAPAPGGTYTVNVAGPRFREPDVYSFRHAPSYRAIYDFGDLENSRYVIPTGESGNPLSPHYDDQFERWLRVDYLRIATADAALAGDRLELVPATEN